MNEPPATPPTDDIQGDGGAGASASPARSINVKKMLGLAASIVIVVGIFVYAIPKFADYAEVWKAAQTLTPLEIGSLVAVMIFNLFTYWWANMAALPGLRLGHAAVLTQTTTSVANTLPGGGAIAVGLTYTILKSWGFTGTDTALYVGVTGLWNIFTKLALPVISIALLVATGKSSTAYITAAIVGIIVLAIAVAVLAAIFASERLARRVGELLQKVAAPILRLFRYRKELRWGDGAVRFRRDTIGLVRHRWIRLTFFTVLSQLALFLVLLVSLRHMGVSEADVSTAEAFAVFAFSRLLSAVPITPGGVGVIDLGYVGGLSALVPDSLKPEVVAAVLLFRLLTYGVQIPIGGFTYLIWRAKRDWRKPAPDQDPLEAYIGTKSAQA
jgi:putative heme transporter